MSELLFFMIGTLLGSVCSIVCMCLVQIKRLSQKEDEDNAKAKRSDTFPS